ncbi:sensor histidine kinase [Arthrobacter roseus]|uniref:sensor histidine kinase n=1 Tax=Arthrobacter roseus TaxID=136274 RepID=UPI0019644E2A|nr:sensor histidine kinase [Arthrobacter roseus]MBM7848024.1 two-component system CitB family sensor kinase [Arthrobacter roseus]
MNPETAHGSIRTSSAAASAPEGDVQPRRKLWRIRLPGRNFAAQILLLQLAVVVLVVVVTASVHGWLTYQRLGEEAEHRALSVARTVATFGDVRAEAAQLTAADIAQLPRSRLANGPLVPLAKDLGARTGALFIVITEDEGMRLTHPNPQRLGERVSTDPTAALNGREVTNQERGTLGLSARAKVPIYAPGSDTVVVGEVSVGFAIEDILDNLRSDIVPVALTAVGALGFGVLASWLLGRRLRRLTLGLEPEEIAALAQDQEAVLRGVDEGVIGISAEGRITVLNAGARSLLGLRSPEDLVGCLLEEAGLPGVLSRLVRQATPESPSIEQVIDSRVLILSARAVQRRGHGQNLGTVIMLRDRTQLQSLTRQLQAVSAMTTALRAQRHEFANRLHTVSGLLGIGDYRQAEEYVGGILATGPLKYPVEQAELLEDPYLQAFIGAKSVEAAERGVHLRIGPETLMRGRVSEAHDVTTVIGNLIDNAIHAAVHGRNTERWVEVEVLDELTDVGGTLHLVVADSGDGTDEATRIFTAGFSTASVTPLTTHGQGVGLPLCRQIARDRGGEVWLAEKGRTGGPGAVFCARLPGTVQRREVASEETNTGLDGRTT